MAGSPRRADRAGRRLASGSPATDTFARLVDRLADHVLVPVAIMGDTAELVVAPSELLTVLRTLRDDAELRYEILADLCGVDTGVTMQVVYHLWSPLSPAWVRVIADGLSRDDPRLPSVTFLWSGAEWAEREAYDMFGIDFEGNRDLRRIYMPPDYLAFPLRKDFVLADNAAKAPGEGIRPMETPALPAEVRARPTLRTSPGTGAVIGPDGRRLRLAAGGSAALPAGQPAAGQPGPGGGAPGDAEAVAGP